MIKNEEVMRLSRHLNPSTVELVRMEYQQISGRPQEDPSLQQGLEILWERRRIEEERKSIPVTTINTTTKEVNVQIKDDIRSKTPNDLNFNIIMLLAERAGSPDIEQRRVAGREIDPLIKQAGYVIGPGQLIDRMRKWFEQDENNPKVILTMGRGKSAAYALAGQVQFIGKGQEDKPSVETPVEPILVPLEKTRIVALRTLFTLPHSPLEDILSTLGHTRADRPFNWATARSALSISAGKLQIRIGRGIATPEEAKLWTDLKRHFNEEKDHKLTLKLRRLISQYFKERKPEKKQEQLKEINETREKALMLLLEDPQVAIEDVLRAISESTRRAVSWNKATFITNTAFSQIHARVVRGTATPEQIELVKKARSLVGQELKGKQLNDEVARYISRWFRENKT